MTNDHGTAEVHPEAARMPFTLRLVRAYQQAVRTRAVAEQMVELASVAATKLDDIERQLVDESAA